MIFYKIHTQVSKIYFKIPGITLTLVHESLCPFPSTAEIQILPNQDNSITSGFKRSLLRSSLVSHLGFFTS